MSNGWIRVTRTDPCPICNKPDWCSVHPDIGICCMRVDNGRQLRNGGYLHKIGERKITYTPPKKTESVVINAPKLMAKFQRETTSDHLRYLADNLGVSIDSLVKLGAAWAGEKDAWAFPMYDWKRDIVGIRLRKFDGSKLAVKGSKQGIFIPDLNFKGQTLYICEGPTDTAAALTLGLHAVGRPSCLGSVNDMCMFIQRAFVKDAVIIVDNDTPGVNGSAVLSAALPVSSCQIVLPAKDMRQFVNNGGTRKILDSIVKSVIWRKHGKSN